MKKMDNAIILAVLPEVSCVMGLGTSHEKYKKEQCPIKRSNGRRAKSTTYLVTGHHN